MTYSKEQIINGIYKYIDNEIISKCDVIHKWLTKTAIDMAMKRADYIYEEFYNNPIIKSLKIINENGNIEIDDIFDILKNNANMYGEATINIPIVGYITISSSDVERLKNYIMNS